MNLLVHLKSKHTEYCEFSWLTAENEKKTPGSATAFDLDNNVGFI